MTKPGTVKVKELQERIEKLKKETSTVILAHLYQVIEIQDVGDFIGDSLGLSRNAAGVTDVDNIIFSAVNFMAEVAKILNPDKNVLIPDITASCPMANQLKASTIREYKKKYPDRPVVVYVNTLAEAKAESDVVCTSANCVEICKKLSEETGTNKLLIGPDKNLAHFIREQTGLDLIVMPENGCCTVHDQFIIKDINLQKMLHPEAIVLVHPECNPSVQAAADFIGSTSQMLKYVKNSPDKEFIIGTERELSVRLDVDYPEKKFYPLSTTGGVCRNMKKNSLEKVYELLLKIKDGNFRDNLVTVDKKVMKGAKDAIDKMFQLMEK
ncbi:MAG: quinolinate synthase NadA [Promethearchaeota archaeon]